MDLTAWRHCGLISVAHAMANSPAVDLALDTRASATVALPSFRTVYEEHFDFVWSCARHLGVRTESLDDVVQEIFVVVHARLHTVEKPASLRGWLYGVARRTVSTYHRARHTRAARELSAVSVEHLAGQMQPSPLDLAVLSDEVQVLWGLLARLDELKRETLILTELEGMTAPEIADALGIPLNTAYSRLRTARQEFAEAYTRHMGRVRASGASR